MSEVFYLHVIFHFQYQVILTDTPEMSGSHLPMLLGILMEELTDVERTKLFDSASPADEILLHLLRSKSKAFTDLPELFSLSPNILKRITSNADLKEAYMLRKMEN